MLKIDSCVSRHPERHHPFMYAGVAVFEASVFRMCPKSRPVPLMELLCQLMGRHSLCGVISWFDIGRRQDLMRARLGSN